MNKLNKAMQDSAKQLSNTKTFNNTMKGNTMKKIKFEDRKLDITVKELEALLNKTVKDTEKQMIAKLKKAFLVK